MRHYSRGTPFVLVGTQKDLRNDEKSLRELAKEGREPITLKRGQEMAKRIKAVDYVECSALTRVSSLLFLFVHH